MQITIDTEKFNPLNWFKKNEEPEIEPPDRVEIVFTEEAQEKGTLDDFNKEIRRFRNGVIVEKKKYYMSVAKSMSKIYEIPILDLTKNKEDDYEFDEITALHGRIRRIVRT